MTLLAQVRRVDAVTFYVLLWNFAGVGVIAIYSPARATGANGIFNGGKEASVFLSEIWETRRLESGTASFVASDTPRRARSPLPPLLLPLLSSQHRARLYI